MRGTLALLAVSVFLAVVGRVGFRLLPQEWTSRPPEGGDGRAVAPALERAALRLLLGFGLVSLALFGLVYFDCFTSWGLAVAGVVSIGLGVVLHRRAPPGRLASSLGRDAAVGLLLGAAAIAFGWLVPPFDLTVAGSDGSVYIAAAHELAAVGRLQHRDALVVEMTEEEKTLFFERTFRGRLPGGIWLQNRAEGRVAFSFYHLLPAWLAFGLKTMGEEGDLRIWTLFPVLSLAASFVLARRLGGTPLALASCTLLMCFLPQAYFVRFPSSELPAQALFLAGLAFLAVPLGKGEPVRAQDAAAAGVLWAAMCLVRIDSIPFLVIGLTLAAFACRRSGFGANAWLVALAWVVAGSSLAVAYQLSAGSYLNLPGVKSAGTLLAAFTGSPWSRFAVFAMALAIVAVAHRAARGAGERRRAFEVVRALCVLPSVSVLLFFGSQWDWSRFARHVEWIAWYATRGGLAVLAAGLVFGSVRWFKTTAEPGARLGLVLLLGPALCYLANPMVTPTQPWAVRRYLPMVFPLFLLLALVGWRALAARLSSRGPLLRVLVPAGVAAGLAISFLAQSARVLYPVVRVPVRDHLRELARTIPERALVLISERDAWLHLQTAFQYVLRRDTLVLPLASGGQPGSAAVVAGYLGRQLAKGRALFLLLARDETTPGDLPRDFSVELRTSQSIEYAQLPFVRKDRFPPRARVGRIDARLYELKSVVRAPSWHEIRIGDVKQDAAVVLDGFYAAEREAGEDGGRPYRWTGPVAHLSLPPVADAALLLDTRRPPGAPPARLEVEIDGAPVEDLRGRPPGPLCLHFRLPKEPTVSNRVVTLRTNAFSAGVPPADTDTRLLGVRVFGVRLDGTREGGDSCSSSAGAGTKAP